MVRSSRADSQLNSSYTSTVHVHIITFSSGVTKGSIMPHCLNQGIVCVARVWAHNRFRDCPLDTTADRSIIREGTCMNQPARQLYLDRVYMYNNCRPCIVIPLSWTYEYDVAVSLQWMDACACMCLYVLY
jgi:hypothetical protein